MESIQLFFKTLYQNFDDRKIDLVITNMTEDVQWANGMDGGYVYGHNGVREYWKRQFKLISSNVTPLEINEENDVIKIKVHQVVHDMNGKTLSDSIVHHHFTLKNGKLRNLKLVLTNNVRI